MNTNEYVSWEMGKLIRTYKEEANELKKALLNGSSWKEVKEKQNRVTDLASAIHKRNTSEGNPAENSLRIINSPFNSD